MKVLKENRVLTQVHVLGDCDVVRSLLEELSDSNIVRLSQVFSDGNVILNLFKLLLNGDGSLQELGDCDIIGSLVEEFGNSRVQKLSHGDIISCGELSDYVLHFLVCKGSFLYYYNLTPSYVSFKYLLGVLGFWGFGVLLGWTE